MQQEPRITTQQKGTHLMWVTRNSTQLSDSHQTDNDEEDEDALSCGGGDDADSSVENRWLEDGGCGGVVGRLPSTAMPVVGAR